MIYHTTSYGILPTLTEFKLLCLIPDDDGHVVTRDGFKFGNCKRVGDCTLQAHELYKELQLATEESTEESLDWASCVLQVLGWEWI